MVQNASYKERVVKFDFVYEGFHSAPITHLDVCIQRPLIATCSKLDSTIRIWNYMDFRCELVRKFTNEEEYAQVLQAIAFHPNGY